jgi:hypothetical protein
MTSLRDWSRVDQYLDNVEEVLAQWESVKQETMPHQPVTTST